MAVHESEIMAKRLQGKVAIITGGADAIGSATARLFTSEGARVVIADVRSEAGLSLADELGPGDARYVHCDVSKEEDVEACVALAVATFGRLDIMFNNVGVGNAGKPEQEYQSITEVDAHVLDHLLSVNTKGTLYGVKHAARAMVNQSQLGSAGTGCILSLCSAAAVVMQRTFHSYTVSKFGVLGVTKTAASELGKHGIRVNCISPTGTLTCSVVKKFQELQPEVSEEGIREEFVRNSELAGTLLEVEDVANAALFLCSEDAKYISGHNLVIDGGFSCARPFNPFQNPYMV